jgi:hypothetical protein
MNGDAFANRRTSSNVGGECYKLTIFILDPHSSSTVI